MELIFATGNKNKLIELRAALPINTTLLGLEDVGILEELPEDHETLRENAIQKARYVFDKLGVACIADDTGLMIDALGGAPGVYSARYAGMEKNAEANMEKVLAEMEGRDDRSARFMTVIALVGPKGVQTFEGAAEGKILLAKRGSDGFGYDPVFQPEGNDRSFAEMSLDEKNRISHRAKAFKKLLEHLKDRAGH